MVLVPFSFVTASGLWASNPEAYAHRLQMMPGLTGAWQVGGRSEVDYGRMIELDLDYVENWSLGGDLWIICKTFLVVLLRQGAYWQRFCPRLTLDRGLRPRRSFVVDCWRGGPRIGFV